MGPPLAFPRQAVKSAPMRRFAFSDPDFDAAFDRALRRLTTDADLRRSLAAASAELCDGQGAPRAAEAFLKMIGARA